MTWARLDDGILDNPKVAKSGPLGFAMHVAGIIWCNRNLTDGFIPLERVRSLLDFSSVYVDVGNWGGAAWRSNPDAMCGSMDTPDALQIADALIVLGLWETADGGYQIHDYLDYNPTRKEVERRRAEVSKVRAIAGKAGGSKRKAKPKQTESKEPSKQASKDESKTKPHTHTHTYTKEIPPVCPPAVGKPKRGQAKTVATGWPEGFAVSAEVEAICRAEDLPNPHLVLPEFRDKSIAKGYTYANWEAAFRNWMRSPITKEKYPPWRPDAPQSDYFDRPATQSSTRLKASLKQQPAPKGFEGWELGGEPDLIPEVG